jgi:integrase
VSEGTKRNRKRALRLFQQYLADRAVRTVDQIDGEMIAAFRTIRGISARTWVKELEILRHFFRHCVDNEWATRNWAEKVPIPKGIKPAEREPYTPGEVARIIAACDVMGRLPYERLRARAIVLLLRYTALRISDVATLKRDRLRSGEILVRTTKNGKPVKLPLHSDLQAALDVLPLPRGADSADCPYLFWSGKGTHKAVVRDVTRTLAAVFKASGVEGACSHRFRHTLAEVLEIGWQRSRRRRIFWGIPKPSFASITPNGRRADRRGFQSLWHVSGTRKNRLWKSLKRKVLLWWTAWDSVPQQRHRISNLLILQVGKKDRNARYAFLWHVYGTRVSHASPI